LSPGVPSRSSVDPSPPSLDLREAPNYRITEASRYLGVPISTIRWWTFGHSYRIVGGEKTAQPVILAASRRPPLLSFINLVELHVLEGIRHDYRIPLPKVRSAVHYVTRHFKSRHPLAEERFVTDGISLLLERFGLLINVLQEGQLAIREVLLTHLERIERDERGFALQLYPFTRSSHGNSPRLIVIDPRIGFGRPVLRNTGIATSTIAERYKAGESINDLSDDYGRPSAEIEEAVRCELHLDAA
jgi:uncharacterized protein (DUF433 family)